MTEVRGAEAWDFLKGSSSGHAGNIQPYMKARLKMLCLALFSGVI
jgi:Flp pilus assembly CpaF family ATPase